MRPPASLKLPKKPKDRFEVHRLFNGLASEGKDGLDRGRLRIPLVKTFLLEHVSNQKAGHQKRLNDIWENLQGEPIQIDESFFSIQGTVKDGDSGRTKKETVGYIEQYDQRFFAYYTVEDSVSARHRVAEWVSHSADLDHTWFSSPFLKSLWDQDVSRRGDHRFTKMVFRHESVFDLPVDAAEEIDHSESHSNEEADADERRMPERRRVRSEMGDYVGRLNESLRGLQDSYSPLHALYALRIPSLSNRGGHDLTQQGQITNRSDSFEDHRNTALYLFRLYDAVLRDTEEAAWGSNRGDAARNIGWRGTPLIVHFAEKLSADTFRQWIARAFQKRNVFKLWGEPIWLGPTKVHVYGADRHLWQPLNLEITDKQLVAILPEGTCGNTFHRLVANIQRFVAPKIDAWIGGRKFDTFLKTQNFEAERNAT